jgi:hypothetical protein
MRPSGSLPFVAIGLDRPRPPRAGVIGHPAQLDLRRYDGARPARSPWRGPINPSEERMSEEAPGSPEGGEGRDDSGDFPHPIYNWMSGIGAGLIAVSIAIVLSMISVEIVTGGSSGYAGLALVPPFVASLIGAGLVLGGWLRERRRQTRGEHSSFFETWVVDPWALVRGRGPWFVPLCLAGITFAILLGGASSVGVLSYSESNQFCTQACHSVMGPEGVVFEQTEHSRIDCVECHVGAGPEGFLTAKLGGIRQLFQFATNTVTRPIPTPIHGGRIDRELCESCHAPERDRGLKSRAHDYFLSGEDVEPVRLAMVVNVGGGSDGLLPGEGVHYHMQIAGKVEYIAVDRQRQEIAWVRSTDAEGGIREFALESSPLSDEERASLPVRTMQCTDCHSRPAHRFPSAVDSVNEALGAGVLSRELPSIKEVSVTALGAEYATTPEALAAIDTSLREFYEEEYPEVVEEQGGDVDAAVATLQAIFERTIFPEMKADWRAHPENSGHRDWPGCFRCHNDELLDADGESITTDCSACHSILAQDDETIASMDDFQQGQAFVHPEDGDTIEEFTLCSDCHTGGAELYE